jgi:hypothetical protein
MNITKLLSLLSLAFALSFSPGCEQDGPLEEAGENVDDALDGEDTPLENAAEEVEDAADDVAEAVEE